MRAALALPLLLLLPMVAAAPAVNDHTYVVYGAGCAGGGALIRNCETYFPSPGQTTVTADANDASGQAVKVKICHEWTYDNGSHPTVWCKTGCDTVTDTLVFPGARTTYRVIVDLRGPAGACSAAATAGTLRVVFS